MLFNSLNFLIFFPAVCVVVFLCPTVFLRNVFLLVASYFFYMNWEPAYALLLLTSTLITFLSGLGIDRYRAQRRKAKLCLTASVVLNLGLLFLFKYYDFAADNITRLLFRPATTKNLGFFLCTSLTFH